MIVIFKLGEKIFMFTTREFLDVGNLSTAAVSGRGSIRSLLGLRAVFPYWRSK
jgi:hypothetical protein